MRRTLLRRLLDALLGVVETVPACGHKPFMPGDRAKGIRLWRRCAAMWCADRFDQVEGWKPAVRERQVRRFGGR